MELFTLMLKFAVQIKIFFMIIAVGCNTLFSGFGNFLRFFFSGVFIGLRDCPLIWRDCLINQHVVLKLLYNAFYEYFFIAICFFDLLFTTLFPYTSNYFYIDVYNRTRIVYHYSLYYLGHFCASLYFYVSFVIFCEGGVSGLIQYLLFVLAPCWEELIKALLGCILSYFNILPIFAYIGFGIFEYGLKMNREVPLTFVYGLICFPPIIMHIYVYRFCLCDRMMFHFLYNIIAVTIASFALSAYGYAAAGSLTPFPDYLNDVESEIYNSVQVNMLADDFEEVKIERAKRKGLNPNAVVFAPSVTQEDRFRVLFASAEDKFEAEQVFDALLKEIENGASYDLYVIQRVYKHKLRTLESNTTFREPTISAIQHRSKQYVDTVRSRGNVRSRRVVAPLLGDRIKPNVTQMNNFFKMHLVQGYKNLNVPKPTISTYTPSRGRAWLGSWAWKLYQPSKGANNWIIGDSKARELWYNRDATPHPKHLQSLLEARLWWGNMKPSDKRFPSESTLFDYFPESSKFESRFLVVNGVEVTTPDVFKHYESDFKRDKPVFRSALAYLSGDTSIDRSVVQSFLNKKFPPVIKPQGIKEDLENTFHAVIDSTGNALYGVSAEFKHLRSYVIASRFLAAQEDPLLSGVKLTAFLTALHESSSWLGVSAVCMQYAAGMPGMREFVEYVKTCSMFTPQSFGDFLSESWSSFIEKSNMKQIWQMIVSAFGFSILEQIMTIPEMVSSQLLLLFKDVSFQTTKKAADTVAGMLVDTILIFVERIKDCFKQRSLRPLFSWGLSPSEWYKRAEVLQSYRYDIVRSGHESFDESKFKMLRNTGRIPRSWTEPFTPFEYQAQVELCRNEGAKVLAMVKNDFELNRRLGRALTSITALHDSLLIAGHVMSTRVQPLGIFIYGPAGAGKTVITGDIQKSIARANGYVYGGETRYDIDPKANFQDGCNPVHWFYVQDDGDISTAPAGSGCMDHFQIVMKYCNNAPLQIEQSDVNLKGKVYGRPLVFCNLTNFSDARLKGYSMYPNAFWRRMQIRIHMAAKVAYSSGGGCIDPVKAATSPDGEIYDIDVSFYDSAAYDKENPFNIPPYTMPVRVTRSELFILLVARFRAHLTLQVAMLSRAKSEGEYCPTCFADIGCSCKTSLALVPSRVDYTFVPQGLEPKESNTTNNNGLIVYAGGVSLTQFGALSFGAMALAIGVSAYNLRRLVPTVSDAAVTVAGAALDMPSVISAKTDLVCKELDKRFNILLSYIPTRNQVAAATFIGSFLLVAKSSRFLNQGREHNATGVVPFAWKRANQEFEPGLPAQFHEVSSSKEEILAVLKTSFVKVKNLTTNLQMWGVVLGTSVILTPFHLASPGDWCLEVTQGIIVSRINVWAGNSVRSLDKDLLYIKDVHLVGKANMIDKFWPTLDTSVSQFDEVIYVSPDKLLEANVNSLKRTHFFGPPSVSLFCDIPTVEGDCGGIYLARHGKQWKMVAMHVGVVNTTTVLGLTYEACAMLVFGVDIVRYMQTLAVPPYGVALEPTQTSFEYLKQGFTEYPPKSEVWAAVSQHGAQVHPIGTAQIKVVGSTTRNSDVSPMLCASRFEDFEVEYCGRSDYWQAPACNGKMIDGKWVSPFTHIFTKLKREPCSEIHLWLAKMDFLQGIGELNCGGFSPISEEETLVGVKGSSIHGVDLKTSAGMPYNMKKESIMKIINGEAFVEPRWYQTRDNYQKLFLGWNFPIPAVVCCKKVEVMKYSKNDSQGQRIFNCLPSAHNSWTKEDSAAFQQFVRNNPGFFECMVGINMTSSQVNDMVQLLAAVDTDMCNMIERDIESQDKSFNGYQYEIAAHLSYAICSVIGISPIKMYGVLMAIKNSVYIVKNDLFQVGAINPSGGQLTVEMNSLSNSGTERYIYYRIKYPVVPKEIEEIVLEYIRSFLEKPVPSSLPFLDFRVHNALVTYGDDALSNVSKEWKPNIQVELIEKFALEVGYVFTDGQKEDKIKFRSIWNCNFLKRGFVRDVPSGVVLVPLNIKSIVKMLRMCKKSSLSKPDEACIMFNNVLRELAYHPKEVFDKFRDRILEVAAEYKLLENARYRDVDYEEAMILIRAGSYQTWMTIDEEIQLPESKGELRQ